MIFECFQTLHLDHNAGIITFSILVYCLSFAGLVIYSLNDQEDAAETEVNKISEQEQNPYNGFTDTIHEEGEMIETEAHHFYSHPAALRYRLSPYDSLERLRNMRKKPDDSATYTDQKNETGSFASLSTLNENELDKPLYNPLISSISFLKSRREKSPS